MTDLTAATEVTRHTALFWGSTLLIVVSVGVFGILAINATPFERIGKSIDDNEPIVSRPWWPAVAVKLATSISEYRSRTAFALAEMEEERNKAEKLAEEIKTVNHIAVHDIKSDLTALLRGSEVIGETVGELLHYLQDSKDEVLIEAIETIKFFAGLNVKSAENAFDVLDQRNKLYDLESKIKIGECSVADLLGDLQAAFSGESRELRIFNDCPENRKIKADYSLFLSVLKNLVRNGFIHNESVLKRVSVRVRPVGHRSHIEIEDNGIGMPESYLADWGKIMGKAARLNTSREGSGAGLYSVRAIIQAHKGASISVESAVGKGTKFILEIDHVS